MKKLKVGIIGCGTIAEGQAIAAKQLKNTELTAVCDVIEENAWEFARKLNVPNVFTDYKEMLQTDLIDAVYNCTPNFMHRQVVVDAAKAKKHILTQKPFANTLEEAQEMCEVASENKVILQSAFFERFRGYCQAMKKCIESGEIGKLKMIKTQMSHAGIGDFYYPKTKWFHDLSLAGGGCLADMGAHHLDLMRWLAQSEVKCIDAQIDEAGTGIPEKNAIVNITYQNGIMAQGHWSFSTIAPEGVCYDKFELYGEKGTVFVTWDRNNAPRFQIVKKGDLQWTDYPYEEIDGFFAMEKHFADCILQHRKPMTTGYDGIKSVETILAAYKSAVTGERQYWE